MNLFFWTLLNLGVPIIGPIFTLALVAPARGWRAARALIAASVKDGQLFWCATGLCASAIYEGVTALKRGSGEVSMLEAGVMGSCLLMFSCSIVVMVYLLSVHDERQAGSGHRQRTTSVAGNASRFVQGASICSVAAAAILFASLHMYSV